MIFLKKLTKKFPRQKSAFINFLFLVKKFLYIKRQNHLYKTNQQQKKAAPKGTAFLLSHFRLKNYLFIIITKTKFQIMLISPYRELEYFYD